MPSGESAARKPAPALTLPHSAPPKPTNAGNSTTRVPTSPDSTAVTAAPTTSTTSPTTVAERNVAAIRRDIGRE